MVRLPLDQRLYHSSPVALAAGGKSRQEGAKFMAFLQTPQARAIFQKWAGNGPQPVPLPGGVGRHQPRHFFAGWQLDA